MMATHGATVEMSSPISGPKQVVTISAEGEHSSVEDTTPELSANKSTPGDAAGMRRMGKEQQLVRHFRVLSMASFTAISTAIWEFGLFLLNAGLVNGGRAGLVWSTLWAFIGFGPVYLSMAEMASMAPIAGAQYHWVSEFAPEKWQGILSYITGWTSTLAWQAGNAQGVFLVGAQIQAMILINNEDLAFPNWHGTLLAFAAIVIAYVLTIYGSRLLPYWQNAVFAIHVLAFFAWFVPVWINAPVASHSQVWTEWSNTGGYSNMFTCVMVGQLTAVTNNLGVDTAAHMAEETKNAGRAIPKAMMWTYLINFCILFPATITVAYHLPDLEAGLADKTTYPFIYVLKQAMSTTWVTVILSLTALILVASNIVYLAAVSRDL